MVIIAGVTLGVEAGVGDLEGDAEPSLSSGVSMGGEVWRGIVFGEDGKDDKSDADPVRVLKLSTSQNLVAQLGLSGS